MTSVATTLNSKSDGDRFPSLASLRAAHSELLKLHREQGNKPEVLAEIEQLIHKGQAAGALLDSEDDRWAAQSLLDYWTSLLYRAGQEPPDATLADFDPALAPDLSDDLCPYMGLESFREKNQNLFFGRQRLIDKLLKHLETNRLLIVVGSSGSGKSSVVMGGLLPRLIAGALPGSQDWSYYAPLVPGSDPLDSLARRLKPANASAAEWISQQVTAFKQNPNHLVQLVEQPDHQPVVLIIDQFEEVFTLCRDDEVLLALTKNLLNFIQTPDVRNTLILTMRTDFESQFVRTPDLLPLFEPSHIRVTALDASELRETIERPAEIVGLKFEQGLVDALIGDVLGEPTALPLLQFTLLKLWDNREHNRVTWEAYQRLGGGRQCLSNSADQFYKSLIYEEQKTAKRILLSMVQPGKGLEVTSNRILRKDLYLSGEAQDRVDRVLDKLIQARLVRPIENDNPDDKSDTQLQLTHEALIRNWSLLAEWLDEERVTLRHKLHLKSLAEIWRNHNYDNTLLLPKALLEDAQRFEGLDSLTQEFVQSSIKAEQTREAEERRQLEEKLRLEAKLEQRKKLNIILSVTAILLSMASFLIWSQFEYATKQTKRAEEQTKRAEEQTKRAEEQTRVANDAQNSLTQLRQKYKDAIFLIQTEADANNLTGIKLALSNLKNNKEFKELNLEIDNAEKKAQQFESEGFKSLLSNDLVASRKAFGKAYEAYPSYHSVYEIYTRVLTQDLINQYLSSNTLDQQKIKKQVLKEISKDYTWQVSKSVKKMIKEQLEERQANVIDPPSNVRTTPNGSIVCQLEGSVVINTYGSTDGWFFTDACTQGWGLIHQSQIKLR